MSSEELRAYCTLTEGSPPRRAFEFQVAVDDVGAAEHRIGEDVPGGDRVGISKASVTTLSHKLGGVRFDACSGITGGGTTLSATVSFAAGRRTRSRNYGRREPSPSHGLDRTGSARDRRALAPQRAVLWWLTRPDLCGGNHAIVVILISTRVSDQGKKMRLPAVIRRLAAHATFAGLMLALTAVSGHACQPGQPQRQPAALNVEESVITPVVCNGPGENGRQYFIYQYTARPPGSPTFRVILPPNWAQALGGHDLFSWQDAAKVVLQAGYDCPIDPNEDAVTAKARAYAAHIRFSQNSADTASYKDYMCHTRVLEYLRQTTPVR
jgi:hypothetical protein